MEVLLQPLWCVLCDFSMGPPNALEGLQDAKKAIRVSKRDERSEFDDPF